MKFIPETEMIWEDAELAREWEEAEKCGRLALGDRILFYPGAFKTGYLPYSEIAWAYMRQEDSSATVCCGRATFESFYLMVVTKDKKSKKTAVEDPSDISRLLKVIEKKNPKTVIGYSKERAERFL